MLGFLPTSFLGFGGLGFNANIDLEFDDVEELGAHPIMAQFKEIISDMFD